MEARAALEFFEYAADVVRDPLPFVRNGHFFLDRMRGVLLVEKFESWLTPEYFKWSTLTVLLLRRTEPIARTRWQGRFGHSSANGKLDEVSFKKYSWSFTAKQHYSSLLNDFEAGDLCSNWSKLLAYPELSSAAFSETTRKFSGQQNITGALTPAYLK